MPKNKTHSGAKDRYKVTGTGKIRRAKQGKSHMMEHKSSRQVRRISGTAEVAKPDVKRARRLLGI